MQCKTDKKKTVATKVVPAVESEYQAPQAGMPGVGLSLAVCASLHES